MIDSAQSVSREECKFHQASHSDNCSDAMHAKHSAKRSHRPRNATSKCNCSKPLGELPGNHRTAKQHNSLAGKPPASATVQNHSTSCQATTERRNSTTHSQSHTLPPDGCFRDHRRQVQLESYLTIAFATTDGQVHLGLWNCHKLIVLRICTTQESSSYDD